MNEKILKNTLIRDIYRALINNGRTYAAFIKKDVLPIIDKFDPNQRLHDPMAGYGSLMTYCSEIGINTCNIEFNPPSYLWIYLINPKNTESFLSMIEKINTISLKKTGDSVIFESSTEWFPQRSLNILESLFFSFKKIAEEIDKDESTNLALSLILPFCGRLSTCVSNEIVANIKKGGLCVYTDWKLDFQIYLSTLKSLLLERQNRTVSYDHELIWADTRTVKLENRISQFLTSPPYPNSRDYFKMFAPENNFIQHLLELGYIENFYMDSKLISDATVSEIKKKGFNPLEHLRTRSSIDFVEKIIAFKGSKRAIYDNKVYYAPYYANYFYNIEQAYINLYSQLSKEHKGYIIVVDNTARDMVIPVSKVIMELFQELGSETFIDHENSKELYHVGSINPGVKGIKAKHSEYAICIQGN